MTEHRIYLIGEHGRIVGVDDSAFLRQEDAVNRAKGLLDNHAAVEVWCGANVILSLKRENSATAA